MEIGKDKRPRHVNGKGGNPTTALYGKIIKWLQNIYAQLIRAWRDQPKDAHLREEVDITNSIPSQGNKNYKVHTKLNSVYANEVRQMNKQNITLQILLMKVPNLSSNIYSWARAKEL